MRLSIVRLYLIQLYLGSLCIDLDVSTPCAAGPGIGVPAVECVTAIVQPYLTSP